jgi:hypothetical protein
MLMIRIAATGQAGIVSVRDGSDVNYDCDCGCDNDDDNDNDDDIDSDDCGCD